MGGLLYSLTGQLSDEVMSPRHEEKPTIEEFASQPEGKAAATPAQYHHSNPCART